MYVYIYIYIFKSYNTMREVIKLKNRFQGRISSISRLFVLYTYKIYDVEMITINDLITERKQCVKNLAF